MKSITPFARDVGLTAITSAVTAGALLLTTRIIADGLGTEGFGAYGLVRRAVATVAPGITVMIGIGLTRALATADSAGQRRSILRGGVLAGVLPAIVLAVPLLAVGTAVVRVGAAMLVSYTVYNVVYTYYRGTRQMIRANAWELSVIAVGPLLVALWLAPGGRLVPLVLGMALCQFAALPQLVRLLVGPGAGPARAAWVEARELTRYGMPRIPAGLALMALVSLGPALGPAVGGLEVTAWLVAAQAVFQLAEQAMAAFGVVVLPHAARHVAEGRTEFLRDRIGDLLVFAIQVGSFAGLQLALWAREIVVVWLGEAFLPAVALMRIMLLALIPYVVYVLLRTVIDAVEPRAVNTRNLLAALATAAALSLGVVVANGGAAGLALSTMMGLALVGVLSAVWLARAGWVHVAGWQPLATAAGLALGALVAVTLRSSTASLPDTLRLGLGIAGGAAALAVHVALLHRAGARWVREIASRFGGRA